MMRETSKQSSSKSKAFAWLLFAVMAGMVLTGIGSGFGWFDKEPAPIVGSSEETDIQSVDAQVNDTPSLEATAQTVDNEEEQEQPKGKTQDESAQWVINNVLPEWASYKYSEVGINSSAWVNTWSGLDGSGAAFETQSREQYMDVHGAAIRLQAEATANIKRVDKAWAADNRSGWSVTFEIHTVSETINVTEERSWEFQVQQRENGTSQIDSFSHVAGGHTENDQVSHND